METRVTSNEISEQMTATNFSYLKISLDKTFWLHRSFFPPFNWVSYLAALGGIIGLWLGLGIIQLVPIVGARLANQPRKFYMKFSDEIIVF